VLSTLLCLLPVLILALPLLARRYPGERVLVALRGEEHPHWPRPCANIPSQRPLVALTARGGLLLGRGLAVRPPPLVAF
jgi:hypothetical protein